MAALAVNRGSAASYWASGATTSCWCARRERRRRAARAWDARACTCAAPTRPTSARASWRSRGAPHGTLVTAAEQTAGRGRQGRRWSAPAGQLAADVAACCARPPPLLPLLAAVAVCDAAGGRARDQVAQRHRRAERGASLAKLAGILVEGRPQEGWAVLGIGLNVAVRARGAARRAARERGDARAQPARSELEPHARAAARARSERAARRAGRGRRSTPGARATRCAAARSPGAAGAGARAGIDGDGRLLVALAGGGRTTLDAGEVHLRRRPRPRAGLRAQASLGGPASPA